MAYLLACVGFCLFYHSVLLVFLLVAAARRTAEIIGNHHQSMTHHPASPGVYVMMVWDLKESVALVFAHFQQNI
jgi:hypothetical protein